MRSFAVASLLAASAAAVPVASNPPSSPYPVSVAQVFNLVARVTKQRTSGAPLDIDNYQLASVHVGAGEDASVLVSSGTTKSASNPFGLTGETYVQNGTTPDIIYGNGYVERYPAQNNSGDVFTFGITIQPTDAPNDSAGHYVGDDVGPGSKGVGIRYPYTGIAFPDSQPILGYTNETVRTYKSQFYACQGSLYNENVIELFWHSENATTPANCTEIVLFAQCAGNTTAEGASAYHSVAETPCYTDASKIPYVGNSN